MLGAGSPGSARVFSERSGGGCERASPGVAAVARERSAERSARRTRGEVLESMSVYHGFEAAQPQVHALLRKLRAGIETEVAYRFARIHRARSRPQAPAFGRDALWVSRGHGRAIVRGMSEEHHPPSRPPVRERIARYASEGARIFGSAAVKVTGRVLGWGTLGFLGAWMLFGIYWALDWFVPIPWYGLIPLWVVYVGLGAFLLGHAGLWRGVGRVVLMIGVEKGLLVYTLDAVLGRVVKLMRRSERVDAALDAGQDRLENLPLETWERTLKKAVDASEADESELAQTKGMRRRVGRFVRGKVHGLVETCLLSVVREEARENGGGGGVSIERVKAAGFEKIEGFVTDKVEGMMRRQTLLMSLALVGASLLTPLILWLIRA